MLAIFERTFAVTAALRVVAAVVAAIAVLTVLFALVSERQRELAVLRVLGASRRQVLGVVLGQAGLLGALGAAGGTAAGLAIGWVLVKVVNVQSFGWSLAFQPPWAAVLWTVLAVVPAAILAGLAPALAALARDAARSAARRWLGPGSARWRCCSRPRSVPGRGSSRGPRSSSRATTGHTPTSRPSGGT